MNEQEYWSPSTKEYLFSTDGRVGGVEFFVFCVLSFFFLSIIGGIVQLVQFAGGALNQMALANTLAAILGLIGFGAVIVPIMSMTIKRLHDWNYSGAWIWVLFVPVVNLALIFVPGTKGANRYGPRSWESYAVSAAVERECPSCSSDYGLLDRMTQPRMCGACWKAQKA